MSVSLQIGDLAAFAGVSTRTVRFYHQRGLLPEPERDSAGYRRYGAEDVIRLVRIVALARAGVPLARVDEVLEGPEAGFRTAITEIQQQVSEQIAGLQRVQESLRTLDFADRVALPPRLAGFIELMREQPEVPAHLVDYLRDSWVLAHALYGPKLVAWLDSESGQVLFTEESIRMTIANLALADADPDDPRVEAHVAETVEWVISTWEPDDPEQDGDWQGVFANPELNELLNTQSLTTPAWRRIVLRVTEELQQRGIDAGWDLGPE